MTPARLVDDAGSTPGATMEHAALALVGPDEAGEAVNAALPVLGVDEPAHVPLAGVLPTVELHILELCGGRFDRLVGDRLFGFLNVLAFGAAGEYRERRGERYEGCAFCLLSDVPAL